jgi:hypothetical protein
MQAKAREVYVPPVLQDLRPALPNCTSHWKNVFLFLQYLDSAFVRLMQAYYGFYRPLESALLDSGAIPVDFDLAPRLKSQILLDDLQALGSRPRPSPVCHSVRRCP